MQHTSNTVDNTYPGGGYVFVWWDRAFTSQATGLTDRGPYGYYEVNDFGTRGKASADILSLYVQDQWSINNLTLNLGLRTEREVIPSFRTDIKAEGFKFNFGDKLAPRLGLSYDVHGDGRFKVYGNWGRYFDWTKYRAVPRRVRRRHLARAVPIAGHHRRLLAVGHQPAGPQPVDARSWQLPRPAHPELRHGRSEPQADEPGCDERGFRVPAQRQRRR